LLNILVVINSPWAAATDPSFVWECL